MAAGEIIHVSLPEEVTAQIQRAVDSGEFVSANDVITEVMRSWSHDRFEGVDYGHLREAWQEAIETGGPRLEPEPVFERVREKVAAFARK